MAHASAEAARACHFAEETWPCDWQVLVDTEDGPMPVECRGLSWFLADGRGYTCEFGHEHIHAEVLVRRGRAYAADPEEAGLLAARGVVPMAMDGGSIAVDPGAFHYGLTL